MTSPEERTAYHLAELEIAADPGHPAHLNPAIPPGARVLDLGCGAGQTLIATAPAQELRSPAPGAEAPLWQGARLRHSGDYAAGSATQPERMHRRPVGVDRDLAALALGRALTRRFPFACASGEALPFREGTFDLVLARVALPYMDLPRALAESRRVLRSGGALWATLHPAAVPWRAFRRANARGKLYQLLVLANGVLFHLTLRLLRLPGGRYESFQTASAIRRALGAAGFTGIEIARGRHFVATASAASR